MTLAERQVKEQEAREKREHLTLPFSAPALAGRKWTRDEMHARASDLYSRSTEARRLANRMPHDQSLKGGGMTIGEIEQAVLRSDHES